MVPYVSDISLVDVFLVSRCSYVTNTRGFTLSLSIPPILVFFLPVLLPISSSPWGLLHFTCRPLNPALSFDCMSHEQWCIIVYQKTTTEPRHRTAFNNDSHDEASSPISASTNVLHCSLRVCNVVVHQVDFTSLVCCTQRFNFTYLNIVVHYIDISNILYVNIFPSTYFFSTPDFTCAQTFLLRGSTWDRIGIG